MLEEKGRLKIQMEENIKKDEIDYKEAKQIISEYPNTILLDVRSKQEYDEGHLPSSICICLYDIDKTVQNIIPNKTQKIIAYCSSGNRSREAKKILENIGYKNVYNLSGGLDAIDN